MRGLLSDFRHAFRLYRRTPGASLIAVSVLAIGMAFVTSFLSLYVDLVLKPHAGFEDSGRLVTLGQTDGERLSGLPYAMVQRASEELTTLEAVVGLMGTAVQTEDETEPTFVEMVTRDFFSGMQPRLHSGRGFDASEHDAEAEPVAVISYRHWQDEFGGRADILDTIVEMELSPMFVMMGPDGQPQTPDEQNPEFRIVGIMGPEMPGLFRDEVAFWIPFERAFPHIAIGPNIQNMMATFSVQAFGRRSDGATAASVAREMDARYADSDEFNLQDELRIDAVDGLVRSLNVQRESKRQLELFLAGSVLMALVAAANVSLFLLARAPGRRRELAIRMSVGAPVKRLARQLASEAGLLVVVAAVIGFAISLWLSGFFRGLAFLQQAEWNDVSLLDWRVLTLVGAFLLVLTLLVSLAPILGLRRLGIAASSRQVAARATWAQRIAGTAQIAIAGTLGGAAVAFGWYLSSLMLGYPGYQAENRFAARYFYDFSLRDNIGNLTEIIEAQVVELARHREAIEALPGVSGVAFGRPVPGESNQSWTQIPDPANPEEWLRVTSGSIDSTYVDVLGLNLLRGRVPEEGETNVALVNQAFAREYFGREDVVGEMIRRSPMPGNETEIIGVLEDLSFGHPAADVEPILFMTQSMSLSATALVESSMTAAALQQNLERIIQSGGLEFRINDVRPLELIRSNILAPDRARGFLTIGTATLVVMLAAFGFYGTQRYLVSAGRREYAIRASLGAGPRSLGRLVFRRGILLSLPGLVIGGFMSFILVAFLRDDYVSRDISPGAVSVAVVLGLTLLLLVASLGPARQARRTQPAPLLKED